MSCNRLDDKVGMIKHAHVIQLQLDEHLPEEHDNKVTVDSDLPEPHEPTAFEIIPEETLFDLE